MVFCSYQINILLVIVSIGEMVIPLYFEILDNNSGVAIVINKTVLIYLTILLNLARLCRILVKKENSKKLFEFIIFHI